MEKEKTNLAFIDGQNLHLGTTQNNWKIDHNKFRKYLEDKYNITEAYYFLGYVTEEEQDLYNNLQKAGFIVVFKEHSSALKGKKKGNVDTDIVFEILKRFIDNDDFNKIILVSGDGNYKKIVDYLIKKDKFKKILFPNNGFASSLYNQLGSEFFDHLENPSIKSKIEFK
ncbi:NYN domain-containing protein [Patescibacteria group bacterium]|nr:NYN domain-containing protein [Patescibacteria group bacterium]